MISQHFGQTFCRRRKANRPTVGALFLRLLRLRLFLSRVRLAAVMMLGGGSLGAAHAMNSRGGPKTSSKSSSETPSGSSLGTTMRALQCGQRPDFPANSLFTCSACPFGQVTLIDIHHLVQENPQGGPDSDGASRH